MLTKEEREKKIGDSSKLIGKAVFNSILITLVSFSPILFLEGQEHKLFSPLVWTKTFAMIGSAFVVIFLVPVLMVTLLKGNVRPESKHPVSRFFLWMYDPIIRWCLKWKKTTIALSLALVLGSVPLVLNLGTEFMPPLDEPYCYLLHDVLHHSHPHLGDKIVDLENNRLHTRFTDEAGFQSAEMSFSSGR